MTTTKLADLFDPIVWGDTAGPNIVGKSVFASISDADGTLEGRPGSTIVIPKWDYIGDAEELTEGVAMDTTAMSMTDSQATIKESGKAVELTDSALLSALGSPQSQAQQQLATSIARKIDADMRTAAEITETGTDQNGNAKTWAPLAVPAADVPMSWNRLTQGFALLGDEWNPDDMAAILMHSSQSMQLMNDPNFIRRDSFGEGAVILRGQVGAIGGVPVLVSDRATPITIGVDDAPGFNALIIRKGALKLFYKRRAIAEADRDILKRTNIVTTNAHYAAKRVDDRGVVIVPTNSAIPTA